MLAHSLFVCRVGEPPPSAPLHHVVFAELSPHPQMHRVNLQPRAHIQEMGHSLGLQNGVDSHPAPRRGIQQVLEDLQVCDEVHDDGYRLADAEEDETVREGNQEQLHK